MLNQLGAYNIILSTLVCEKVNYFVIWDVFIEENIVTTLCMGAGKFDARALLFKGFIFL